MRIAVGDVRLFFDVEGAKLVPDGPAMREKPTLLLLHGGPGLDHSLFMPWFTKFQDEFQVVYLDHRGNGRSDPGSTAEWRLDRWADDVRTFCDALEIEKPIVLGVSFGGIVAQAYATRHPDHPGALILCSTGARFRADRVLVTFERLGGLEARHVAAQFFADPSPESLADYSRVCLPLYTRRPMDPDLGSRCILNLETLLSFFAGEWRTFDFIAALARVRCPTLVLSGEEDPIMPVAAGEELATALPARVVRFERFPGCGHPVFEDDEEGCFAVIRAFLRSATLPP